MPRNMSFFLTTQQIREGSKTVTRRNGWEFLKEGDILNACVKCQGLKKGQKVEKIRQITIKSTRWERLDSIDQEDVTREGFPHFDPRDFIDLYCKHNKVDPSTLVNRIEFEYVPKKITFIQDIKGSDKWLFAYYLVGKIKGNRIILSPLFHTKARYKEILTSQDNHIIMIEWPDQEHPEFLRELSALICEIVKAGNQKDIFILSEQEPDPELLPFINDRSNDSLEWTQKLLTKTI